MIATGSWSKKEIVTFWRNSRSRAYWIESRPKWSPDSGQPRVRMPVPSSTAASTQSEVGISLSPASIRPMFFRQGSDLANVSGKLFPNPALLFAVRSGVLFVRALPESKRPAVNTKLAAAPYWNIDSNGRVCAGTMRIPKSVTVASISAWQQAFFQSEFTHPGGAGRLTTRKGGTTALWRGLVGKKRFPPSALIPTETVQDYLRKLEAEQR